MIPPIEHIYVKYQKPHTLVLNRSMLQHPDVWRWDVIDKCRTLTRRSAILRQTISRTRNQFSLSAGRFAIDASAAITRAQSR